MPDIATAGDRFGEEIRLTFNITIEFLDTSMEQSSW